MSETETPPETPPESTEPQQEKPLLFATPDDLRTALTKLERNEPLELEDQQRLANQFFLTLQSLQKHKQKIHEMLEKELNR